MQTINTMMIIVGILLLILGRKLYWLSVGAVGFLLGYYISTRFFSIGESWINFLIAIICGFTIAFLIYYFQRFAIALAGLIIGTYIVILLLDYLNIPHNSFYWIAIAIGAFLGIIFGIVLFDWTLILLSSLSGSFVIIQNLPFSLPTLLMAVAFILLFLLGVFIQSKFMGHR